MNIDDPRLTAYALGELESAERAALDAELQSSPELRAELEEIRRTAQTLTGELAAEPPLLFYPVHRSAIEAGRESAKIIQLPPRRPFRTAAFAALAASILALLAWQFWFAQTPRHVAVVKPIATNVPHLAYVNRTEPAAVPAPKPATSSIDTLPLPSPKPVVTVAPAPPAPSTPAPPAKLVGLLDMGAVRKQIFVQPNEVKDAQVQPLTTELSKLQAPESAAAPRSTLIFKNTGAATDGVTQAAQTWAPKTHEAEISVAEAQKVVTVDGGNSVRSLGYAGQLPEGFGNSDAGRARKRMLIGRDNRITVLPPGRAHSYSYYGLKTSEDTAAYPHLVENSFMEVLREPLSTFSADVDGASYANVRRFLNENQLPPHDAVRLEEMLNYFSYDYPQPRGEDPFSVNLEVAGCPWNADHRLVRIGIKGRDVAAAKRAPGNFVFLIDVSGSMEPAERLPLIKQALRHLVMKLNASDRVAIVVYASEAGVKLPSTPCSQKEKILEAIDELTAGGSTNGGDGIQQAYRVAREHFISGGVNRVLLCTDGDFNVGITDQGELTRMIERKAKDGVFLTTLGVGTDNYKDALMQKLADKGNGNYYYLDSQEEAQRVLIEQMNGTLVTIAKDVKMQVEFNPAEVAAYRLIGYEKRIMPKQDFNNDAKDAGEIGAGHTVTALYEIVPAGGSIPGSVDDLKYQPSPQKPERYRESGSREMLTLKLRYKQPTGDRSRLMEVPLTDGGADFERASVDFKFAAAVASFGMLLQDSEFKGNASYSAVEELARSTKGADDSGYRSEFINLVRKAGSLAR